MYDELEAPKECQGDFTRSDGTASNDNTNDISTAGGTRNVIFLGLGFFLVSAGFQPVQTFATSLLDTHCLPMGSISIGPQSPRHRFLHPHDLPLTISGQGRSTSSWHLPRVLLHSSSQLTARARP